MTGEVTLRGRVLPIGGLREKSMAALRNGIKTVIIPKDTPEDLEEIDQTVRARPPVHPRGPCGPGAGQCPGFRPWPSRTRQGARSPW